MYTPLPKFSYRPNLLQFVTLTKPRIVILLALTGAVAFELASPYPISIRDLMVYLLSGYFAAGGAMALNNAIDSDIDQRMIRTANRSSVTRISGISVAVFGSSLFVSGVLIALAYFGIYTALFLAWGGLFYIIGYSLLLKRKTVLNTIIGGLASPSPILGAYAAYYDLHSISSSHVFLGVPTEGWLLGLLVFLWTPSHTWAMAVKNYDDYCNVNIPMLPVIIGIAATALVNFLATIALVVFAVYIAYLINPASILLIVVVSLGFLYSSLMFYRYPTKKEGTKNFHSHNIWLGLVFLIFLL